MVDWVKTNWQGLWLFLVNPIAVAFKLIYDNCDGFRNFINNFVNSVKELFINGWNAIVLFFTQTISQFKCGNIPFVDKTILNPFLSKKSYTFFRSE